MTTPVKDSRMTTPVKDFEMTTPVKDFGTTTPFNTPLKIKRKLNDTELPKTKKSLNELSAECLYYNNGIADNFAEWHPFIPCECKFECEINDNNCFTPIKLSDIYDIGHFECVKLKPKPILKIVRFGLVPNFLEL
jgi:hypothetical protein